MLPKSLQASGFEIVHLPDGRELRMPKATPTFEPWRGAPLRDTYGRKQVLDFDGAPLFAELVILRHFQAAGWQGAWIDTYRKRILADMSFAAACERSAFRLTHFSIQRDHLHLLVEADDARSLGRGMKSIAARVARCVNRVFRRAGPIAATTCAHCARRAKCGTHGVRAPQCAEALDATTRHRAFGADRRSLVWPVVRRLEAQGPAALL